VAVSTGRSHVWLYMLELTTVTWRPCEESPLVCLFYIDFTRIDKQINKMKHMPLFQNYIDSISKSKSILYYEKESCHPLQENVKGRELKW
jgi:hypothetical protein